eukprot:Selendium_serpulae@DN7038_c0_g1_i1.p1
MQRSSLAVPFHIVCHLLVFGESVLNDAVSVVIYNSVQKMFYHKQFQRSTIEIIKDFGSVASLSVFMGLAFGGVCSFLFKRAKELHRFPDIELGLTLLTAYLTFGSSTRPSRSSDSLACRLVTPITS